MNQHESLEQMYHDLIDYFALKQSLRGEGEFLRYLIAKPQVQNGLGSVLILPDYGTRIEGMVNLIAQLNERNVYSIFRKSTVSAHESRSRLECDRDERCIYAGLN